MKNFKNKLYTFKRKLCNTFTDETGDFYISDAVKIIIAVVLGSLVLAALTVIFNNTVIPGVTQKIESLF